MASINSDALQLAVNSQVRYLRSNEEFVGETGQQQRLMAIAVERVLAGQSLSDSELAVLRVASAAYLSQLRQEQRRLDLGPVPVSDEDRAADQELQAALERTIEGLAAWPVLSPLAAGADIPVPEVDLFDPELAERLER